MTLPRPRPVVQPRIWSDECTAHRLGMSVNTFRAKAVELAESGFPARDDLLGGYDIAAVEAWLDKRAGIATVARTANPGNDVNGGEATAELRRRLKAWAP